MDNHYNVKRQRWTMFHPDSPDTIHGLYPAYVWQQFTSTLTATLLGIPV